MLNRHGFNSQFTTKLKRICNVHISKCEISEFNTDKKRLWVEILNKSIEEPIKIKKNQPLGLIVIEPEHLKLKYEFEFKTVKKRRSYESKKIQTTWRLP